MHNDHNPFMTNGLAHHYHLGEPAFIFGDIRCSAASQQGLVFHKKDARLK